MGGAITKNVADITVQAISNQSMTVINNSKAGTDQSQIITVSNVDGDVVISGNLFNQQATINTENLLKNLSTQKAQQDLSQKLTQAAKSLVSGINLGQYTKADNTTNAFMSATINLVSNINQSCGSTLEQNQVIRVDTVKGNVMIKNNSMKQVGKIFQKCITDNLSSQESIQKLQQQIDQSASAESKGVSIWAIVILALIALLGMAAPIILPAMGIIAAISKFLFPLLFIIGVVLIILYFTKKNHHMTSYGYSKLLQDANGSLRCGAKKISESTDYQTATEAEKACLEMAGATAYDWKGFNIDTKGNAIRLAKPKTTFYNGTNDSCPIVMSSTDNMRIIRMPKVGISDVDPRTDTNIFQDGDVYINPKTTEWFKLIDGEWSSNDVLAKNIKGKVTINSMTYDVPDNSSGSTGDVIIKFAGDFKPFFNIYTKNDKNAWDTEETCLPGYAPDSPEGVDGSASFNTSGFKKDTKNPLFLWIGVVFMPVGLFGTIMNFVKKQKPVAQKITKTAQL